MRVTSNMMSNHLLNNLNRNAAKMNNTQLQMSTGMKINKPSDDPSGITYSLRYRHELASNDQYQRNVSSATSWLEFNDTVISQSTEIVQRMRELTVQGSNGSNPQSAFDSISAEIAQLKEQLIDVGNSQLNGKYVLNGEMYDKKPYDFSKLADGSSDTSSVRTLDLDKGTVKYTVGAGVDLKINVSGSQLLGGDEDDNVFTILDNITKALASGDTDTVQKQLGLIDSRMDKIASLQAEVGAKSNRVDLMQNRLTDLDLNLTTLQSKTEDADYSALLIKSKVEENVYNASLSVGAKIINTSLLDFLR